MPPGSAASAFSTTRRLPEPAGTPAFVGAGCCRRGARVGDDQVLLGPQRQHRLITAIAIPRLRGGRLPPAWPPACRRRSRWRRCREWRAWPGGGIADRGKVQHWPSPDPAVAMVESLLALWAAGGERADDLDHFRQDKALALLLGHDLPA